jgi:hypothetical protein
MDGEQEDEKKTTENFQVKKKCEISRQATQEMGG